MSDSGIQASRKETPDVSVIVPMHNAARYVEQCIESLTRQSYASTRYEIIVVDNNSTDDSKSLAEKYSRVQLLSEGKQGSYTARNRGVKAARGQILAFTDADCAPDRQWLTELTRPFVSPEIGVVQGRRVFASESRVLSTLAEYEAEHAAFSLSPEGKGTHFGYTNNMAVRREVFERCGPFLEIARGADSVFVDRVVRNYSIDSVRFARDAVICHLEMTGVTRWLIKRAIRGRSLQQTRRIRGYRRVGPSKMPLILKRASESGNYSAVDRALLLMMIGIGTVAFDLGRVSSRWSTLMGRQSANDAR